MTSRRVVLTLLAALFTLAFPVAASAATYTVDSTGDQADEGKGAGGCKTAVNTCTLRAALEESNFSTGVADEIKFAAAFNGQSEDTITALTLLPAIVDPVSIKGGSCTQLGQQGPCTGVDASSLSYGLSVDNANGVAIEGLAITGALTGIRAVTSSQNLVARNNWLGVKLEGANGTGANTGIWLDPDSNGATIGGTAAGQGNVFANNAAEGLDIEGADNTEVLGNYFGVKPDGATQATNGKDIEITDTVAFEATGNEVGTAIPSGSLAAPCDAGCNVISGATFAGIDLQGNGGNEEPATGPTTIQGNYIGLSAAGTGTVGSTSYGVWSVAAEAVTVGGEENGEGNFFAGGGVGIYHQDGKGFAAIGNVIGSGPSGADLAAPNLGMFVYCLELGTKGVDPVVVDGNVFRMDGTIAIEEKFGNAEIEDNFIENAQMGIYVLGDPPGAGNLIRGNVIGDSTAYGILIESDFNTVIDNAIYGSGDTGVRIQNPGAFPLVITTGNLIGGTSAGEENIIRESGGDAIEIADQSGNTEEDSYNAVGRNKGDENAGLFINLIGNANGGILPLAFASQQSTASGSGAEPNATIRVFRKETSEAGEIESFLAETEANGSGEWKVAYPAAIPIGTVVGATQTSVLGGTSELAMAIASADPSGGGGGGAGGGGSSGGGGPAPSADTQAPTVTITKAPKAKTTSTTAKFKFKSNEVGSKFQCKLDKGKFVNCKSPKTYKKLKPGKHVFKVRAIDKAGNVGKPAKRKFTVLTG